MIDKLRLDAELESSTHMLYKYLLNCFDLLGICGAKCCSIFARLKRMKSKRKLKIEI